MTREEPTFYRRFAVRGYTLSELLVATASASLLMGGLASSLHLSGLALAPDNASLNAARSARALAAIREDLRHATSFLELTNHAVTFTAPDRDNDGLQETIRYAWSGSEGDPLRYRYNNAAESELLANVQEFDLSSLTRSFFARPVGGGGEENPVLLFVVSDENAVSLNEASQFQLFANWGLTPKLISGAAGASDLAAASADVSVIFVSSDCSNAASVGVALASADAAVICESLDAAPGIGFASNGVTRSAAIVRIEDNPHEITAGLAPGNLALLTNDGPLHALGTPVASGGDVLATLPAGGDLPALLAIEAGGTLQNGDPAPARRVMTPFGGPGFSAELLNSDGQTLLRNVIEWALADSSTGGGGGSGGGAANLGVNFVGVQETPIGDDVTQATMPTPAGEIGDLLIAAIVLDDENAASIVEQTGGWDLIAKHDQGRRVTLGVWSRRATADDDAIDLSWDNRSRVYGWVMRFNGQHQTQPIDASQANGSSSTTPTANSVTTSVDNCLVLRIGGFDSDDITPGDPGVAGHTPIVMNVSHSGFGDVSGGAAYIVQPSLGATGDANFTLTGSEEFRTVTIAIAPESP